MFVILRKKLNSKSTQINMTNPLAEQNVSYQKAEDAAYQRYRGLSREELLTQQKLARATYRLKGATHEATANCMVIAKLLGDI